MFDGVPVPMPEHLFHQFIAQTRTTTTLHHHLSSSSTSLPPILHHHASPTPNNNFLPLFDPYNPSRHHHQIQPHFHPLQHNDAEQDQEKEPNSTVVPSIFETDQRQRLPHDDELMDSSSWTNDEVLALLRIRSSMESWFPELTWDHVSRKLAELGFKKSAEKCKEKFEDESRYFNTNINSSKNYNYRFLSELEELYQGSSDHNTNNQNIESHDAVTDEKTHHQLEDMMGHNAVEDDSSIKQSEDESEKKNNIIVEKSIISEKRKRKRGSSIRFEMFKGFCESFVNKMMAQHEEMHNKILEDMMKRDQEKIAREEAWKKQEMEKMNNELEIMAREQAIAGDRQATIIQFLKKCAANNPQNSDKHRVSKDPNQNGSTSNYSSPPPLLLHSQNPNPSTGESNLLEPITTTPNIIPDNHQIQTTCSSPTRTYSGLPITTPGENPSLSSTLQVLSSPSSSSTHPNNSKQDNNPPLEANSESTFKPSSSSSTTVATNITDHHQKDDVGRRWPRDEVLALINLRCTTLNNNNELEKTERNNTNKVVPLWERISQRMIELGYKRSAKRCKEKWENINKYFRKTKDVNKKRSIDSRTCPYFHQLRNLYSQGQLLDAHPQTSSEKKQENQLNNSGQLAESSSHHPVGCGEFSSLHRDDDHHGGEETTLIHTTISPLNFD